jgi:hypothetical protein
MAIVVGQTLWHAPYLIEATPEGCPALGGGTIICKNGGVAWIVAPASTQVGQTWNNNTTTLVGNKCCVCDWPTLNTAIINAGLNPSDWFVPSCAQLQCPGYCCRTKWDSFCAGNYWSSTECNATRAYDVVFSNGSAGNNSKTLTSCVRAFRCVTY